MTLSAELWPDDAVVRSVPTSSGKHVNAIHIAARASSGQAPTVLVHGFRGTSGEWGPFSHLLAADRDVWVLELPGHDAREDAEARAWSGSTEDHFEAIDAVHLATGAPQVEIIGQSYGGFLVGHWSARRPEAWVRTVLIAPALVPLRPWFRLPGMGRLLTNPKGAKANRAGYLQRLELGRDEFFSGESPTSETIPVEWREALFQARLATAYGPEAERREGQIGRTLTELMPHNCSIRETQELLRKLREPFVWLHGSGDPLVPFAPSKKVTARTGRAFIDLGPIGHCPHLECPELTLQIIESWRATT